MEPGKEEDDVCTQPVRFYTGNTLGSLRIFFVSGNVEVWCFSFVISHSSKLQQFLFVLHLYQTSDSPRVLERKEGQKAILVSQLKPLLQRHWHNTFDEVTLVPEVKGEFGTSKSHQFKQGSLNATISHPFLRGIKVDAKMLQVRFEGSPWKIVKCLGGWCHIYSYFMTPVLSFGNRLSFWRTLCLLGWRICSRKFFKRWPIFSSKGPWQKVGAAKKLSNQYVDPSERITGFISRPLSKNISSSGSLECKGIQSYPH